VKSPGAKVWAPILALAIGIVGFGLLVATRPAIETQPPAVLAPLVRVIGVETRDVQLTVRTHGTVAPRTESELIPEVSGTVVWLSPSLVSGGFFEQDVPLLRIDRRDYEAAVERARALVAQRTSEHDRASKELERRRRLAKRQVASAAQLDDAVNAEHVAAAAKRGARVELDQALRDLTRTEIRAPYAGRVRDERVDVGLVLSRGVPIATLYAVDYAEVRLPVPDDDLAVLDLPSLYRGGNDDGTGPRVILRAHFAGSEREWHGRVVRTEGEIDPKSRMVHVVARVDDPYARRADDGRPPLAVGLFVEAEILGRRAEGVVVLPRAALRSDGRVLVVDDEQNLRFREVEVLRKGRDELIISSGLAAGDRVCISPLEAAVDGMAVRTVGGPEVIAAPGERS
jgi:RND family efflux transporter MFP subunit